MKALGTLGAAAILLAAVAASAQPAAPPPGGPGRGMLQRLEKALNLTTDQQTAVQKLVDQQKPQMDALHQQMQDNRQKLDAALSADSPDAAAVGTLTIEQHKLMQQGKALHDQLAQSLRALLTPDQQTKFDALQSMGGPGRWGGGRGHWGGGGAAAAPPTPQQ
ncbi:MAG TPA: periplasmic heavy metal sensor [Vicinamibacteria bacterium]|nr:periplasmic heavy metal sensor [Vicinamibacteria bacterium]